MVVSALVYRYLKANALTGHRRDDQSDLLFLGGYEAKCLDIYA
jgi:hypothetical protein